MVLFLLFLTILAQNDQFLVFLEKDKNLTFLNSLRLAFMKNGGNLMCGFRLVEVANESGSSRTRYTCETCRKLFCSEQCAVMHSLIHYLELPEERGLRSLLANDLDGVA